MSTEQSSRVPTPSAQRVFHAPEIWLILRILGAVPPETIAPADAGFEAGSVGPTIDALLRSGAMQTNEDGVVELEPVVEALVHTSAFPRAVIMANISDKGAQAAPARVVCFSRDEDEVVVNWVDERGDHHFAAYPAQDAGLCVLMHLALACDLNVTTPDAALPSPTRAEYTRAAEQMKQAVALTAVTATDAAGQPSEAAQAAGWFVSGNTAWLMASKQPAPRRASKADIAQTVMGLAEQLFGK